MIDLFGTYPCLSGQKENILAAVEEIVAVHQRGGKILLAGNGGSAADCAHIAGELTKRFLLPRPLDGAFREALASSGETGEKLAGILQGGFAAIDLTSQSGSLSAFSNDVSPESAYAQLVCACGRRGDLLIGISTSGNSENIVRALVTARAMGMRTVALTGGAESRCSAVADVAVRVPAAETYKVQELHLPVYHFICAEAERRVFGQRSEG